MNKLGATNMLVWVVVIIGGLWLVQSGALGDVFGGITTGDGDGDGDGVLCPSSAETLTINAKEKWTTGVHDATRVWVNGVDQGNKSDASTVTVGIGSTVIAIPGFESADVLSDYMEFDMPCRAISTGDPEFSGGAHEVIRVDTAPAVLNWFNSDDGNVNTATENLTIGADGTGSVTLDMQFASKQGFGNKRHGLGADGYILAVVELNDSNYDQGDVTFESYEVVSTPDFLTPTSTEFVHKTFKIPGCANDQQLCEYDGTLRLEASSKNPEDRVNVTFYAPEFDLLSTDSSSDGIIFEVEDDQDARSAKYIGVGSNYIYVA